MDQGVLGVWSLLAAKGPIELEHAEVMMTWHNVCFAELSMGSAPVANLDRGGHGCIRH